MVKQRDSVALSVFDADWRVELPASSSMGNVNTILHTLEEHRARGEDARSARCSNELADRVRRRGLVFIISDCFDEVDTMLKGLKHLRFQRARGDALPRPAPGRDRVPVHRQRASSTGWKCPRRSRPART